MTSCETTGATVTVACPLFPSTDAVIVAVPAVNAVTSPLSLTFTVVVADEAQATDFPARTVPRPSRTVADSCCVLPRAVSVTVPGETSTEAVTPDAGLEGPPESLHEITPALRQAASIHGVRTAPSYRVIHAIHLGEREILGRGAKRALFNGHFERCDRRRTALRAKVEWSPPGTNVSFTFPVARLFR